MYRDSLIEFRGYFVTNVFDKFISHLNEFDREEVNYIFNLLDDCLFNPEDLGRIRLLYTELNGLYRFNYVNKPIKYMFIEKIEESMNLLGNLLNNTYHGDNL
jgi:hypothetical protein